jgi:hypothetical protein
VKRVVKRKGVCLNALSPNTSFGNSLSKFETVFWRPDLWSLKIPVAERTAEREELIISRAVTTNLKCSR